MPLNSGQNGITGERAAAFRRGFDVNRYHTQNMLIQETVGHHTANAMAIAYCIDPSVSKQVLLHLLLHDVAEAYTGDIPAPVKRHDKNVKSALDYLEFTYLSKLNLYSPTLLEEERFLVKCADLTDLICKCLVEVKMGNKLAYEVAERGVDYLIDLHEKHSAYPEPHPYIIQATYIIQHIAEA